MARGGESERGRKGETFVASGRVLTTVSQIEHINIQQERLGNPNIDK